MSFRAVLSLSPAASAASEGFVAFLFSGTRIAVLNLSVSRVPISIFISAEVGCIPRLFIISRDTFFVRRKTLLAVLLEL
jgi:hypothetical protein